MGVARFKNDVKTLFLILNTFNMIATGLFPVSIGVGLLVTVERARDATWVAEYLAVGAGMLALAALGSCGAVLGRKALLDAYLMGAGLAVVVEVGTLVLLRGVFWPEFFFYCIFHPCVMLTTMVLAGLLAKQIHKESSLRSPAATAL